MVPIDQSIKGGPTLIYFLANFTGGAWWCAPLRRRKRAMAHVAEWRAAAWLQNEADVAEAVACALLIGGHTVGFCSTQGH